MERDETTPFWGLAPILAMATGASFWVGLIWAVMPVIRYTQVRAPGWHELMEGRGSEITPC
jgi:hypothetical protein